VRRDVAYEAAGGARVTAWLVAPEAKGPHAGVLWLHWGFGSRDSFLAEAEALAAAGLVSLLPNAPGYGGRPGPRPPFRDAAAARAYAEQAVAELRAGLDRLCAEPGVDAARIAYVGHSLGASLGGQLLGADPRVSAAVLLGGTGRISRLWLTHASDAERAALSGFDGADWIRRSKAACLFQYAEEDAWIPRADTEEFVAAAPQGKRVAWYACDHTFDDAARRDRAAWLRERLALGALDEAALAGARLPGRDRFGHGLVKRLLAVQRRFVALQRRFAKPA
jgi:dienelactone hydrolase